MAPSAMSRNALLLAVVSLAVHAAFGQNITTNLPQVEYPAFNSTNNDGAANITTYLIENNGPNGTVQTGHLSILHNPIGQFVVLPPAAGCVSTSNGVTTGGRSLTSTTAAAGNCHVAANGALFNVTTGGCLGNLVSNGVVIQAPGTQNVNFGLRNGNFVIGYVSALEAQGRAAGKVPFDQLTSGVVWLVKGGQNNVQQDLPYEDPSTQTTGTIQDFASIVSARTAIGHNAAGEILLLQLDGQSNVRGASLYDVADLLISYGAVNAINLDGGGSSAFVTDGILSSYPSDILNATVNGQTFSFRQERAVTSIVCFKDRFKIAPSQPCDPTSQNPNQCFNAAGTLSICCPGACPLRPGPLAVCGPAVPPTTPSPNTVSASSPTTVTTPGSTTGAPTGPVVAAPTVAPTTAGPVPSGTTATAPAKTSAPGVAAGTPPPCDPTSGNPNQCFNAPGTASLCCPGQCPQNPGPNPVCGPTLAPAPTFAQCDPTSATPNQCFNAAGSQSICCPGQCPGNPGATAVCGGLSPATGSPGNPSPTSASGSTTGGSPPCDPTSNLPNQCFNAAGSQSICCPGQCPGNPGATAVCGGPSPATGSPGNPSPTSASGSTTGGSPPCDPMSNLPNQCFNAAGSQSICCPGQCPGNPGASAVCGGPSPATGSPGNPSPTSASGSTTGGSPPCNPTSNLPNQCFNAPGTASICCPGQCPNNPGPTPFCA